MRNIELIENSKTQVLDQIVDRLWPVIKPGACGQYTRARVRQPEHIFEVDRIVRRLARNEHELSAFLKADICRPMNKVSASAGCDRSQRSHGTRDDDHSGLPVRTG